jgi:hypothetical protein
MTITQKKPSEFSAATVTALRTKLNSIFNILDYGASTSATAADNTTAINAAITAAAAVFGTVYIPHGIYLVNTINYDPACNIIGDKTVGSILRSASAVPLLQFTGSFTAEYFPVIRDIKLDGNNVGTIGFDVLPLADFIFENVWFSKFTSYCVKLHGALVGSFTNCMFETSANGVSAETYGAYHPNLVSFQSCRFLIISGIAINWSDGSGLSLNGCDIGSCDGYLFYCRTLLV